MKKKYIQRAAKKASHRASATASKKSQQQTSRAHSQKKHFEGRSLAESALRENPKKPSVKEKAPASFGTRAQRGKLPTRNAPSREYGRSRQMSAKAEEIAQKKTHASRFPSQHRFEGTIRINSKGVGFVAIPEIKDEDIEVGPAFLHTALDGDRVEILLHSKIAGIRQGGEVTKIITRNKTKFVGVIDREDGTFFCIPDDTRMYRPILIPKQHSGGAKKGDKVFVEMTKWTDATHEPLGQVLKIIGKAGVHNVEMESIVLERGFDATFAEDVLAAAERIPTTIDQEEIARRKDFRTTLTMTIDPHDAKDFDDALSWKKLPNGNIEVGVHIADVTHYVTPGSRLDQEGAERGTSIYLVDRTIPMLPERLSNGICSLVPDQDRLTFSAVFELNAKAEIVREWFGKTVIHSHKRFSYEEAQSVLDTKSGPYAEPLTSLNTLAKRMREERIKNGAIAFEGQEVRFELDANGKPIRVYQKEFHDSNRLIEEFMLLANRRVAEYIATHDKNAESVFVYRVHDAPVEEKIAELRDYLKTIGITLRVGKDGKVSSRDINTMLNEIRGHAEETMIQIATIRAMSKAVYSTKNIGHYGLGFEYYTHFTSPIRRYPDMMVHRLLFNYLIKKPVPKKALVEQEHIARYASEMEVAAAEAERASIKFKQVEYWGERVGERWEGRISGVTEWGIYVEDLTTRSEGMISLRDIPDDFYFFEQKNYRIVGKNTGRVFKLGDPILARVRSVDFKKKQISLSPVNQNKNTR